MSRLPSSGENSFGYGCRDSEISRAWFSDETTTMGVSGEHGGSLDAVMERPNVSLAR